jgi:hypothetical protein
MVEDQANPPKSPLEGQPPRRAADAMVLSQEEQMQHEKMREEVVRNFAKQLDRLELAEKLAKATGDLGKNLGKAGEKLIKVWDLNDLKDDAVEMKEHLLNAQASANQARSEGFSHGTPMNLKLRGLSSSRSPKEEHTRRQGEEEKRELKEEAAARRRFLAALAGLRLDTSEDEAAPRKVRVRACVGSLCAVRVCLCGCKCVRVCLWGGGGRTCIHA